MIPPTRLDESMTVISVPSRCLFQAEVRPQIPLPKIQVCFTCFEIQKVLSTVRVQMFELGKSAEGERIRVYGRCQKLLDGDN